ncbi:MAG: hypothetical protein DWI58_13870 [Chloroflexi bacterium]|nr:MAG: hypothetical protein DWI58_13870 [Chloroflexota bacterium]
MTTVERPRSAAGADPATRERLRALIRAIETRAPRPAPPPSYVPRVGDASEVYPHEDLRVPQYYQPRGAPVALHSLPGARLRDTASGTCVVREVRRPLAAPPGLAAAGEAFDLADLPRILGAPLVRLAPDAELEDVALEDLLFLDIETTGLGGAGAMAFLVATGHVEGDEFVLRQYIAPSPPAEASLLEALIEDAGIRNGNARTADPVLVTYNGRMFDAPMLDGRATMHRLRGGFDALRHLDLLLPARIAYRGLLPSCRLIEMEYALLGMTRPPSEASGAEAPGWYFRFLRTGDARMLIPIIEHNERDVVALAALTGRMAALAEQRIADGDVAKGIDALAAGRLLAKRGEHEAARTHFERAIATVASNDRQVEAMLRLAALHKAEGRRDLAAPLWHAIAARPGAPVQRVSQELAIYYERHARDFAAALAVVEHALAAVPTLARLDPVRAGRWQESLLLRRSRVQSRLARSSPTD